MNHRRLAGATVVGVLLLGLFGIGAQRFYYSRPLQKEGHSAELTAFLFRLGAYSIDRRRACCAKCDKAITRQPGHAFLGRQRGIG